MEADKYNQLCRYWGSNQTGQRLGQYLMNNLTTAVSDPEIFYTRDKDQAATLFYERYVKEN